MDNEIPFDPSDVKKEGILMAVFAGHSLASELSSRTKKVDTGYNKLLSHWGTYCGLPLRLSETPGRAWLTPYPVFPEL
ncbi:MAG: hypothetical protein JW882_05600 [Deltaproteobacteria bacterium]|nr:hypothetical protein [Deltaproteobacteria bacterium]